MFVSSIRSCRVCALIAVRLVERLYLVVQLFRIPAGIIVASMQYSYSSCLCTSRKQFLCRVACVDRTMYSLPVSRRVAAVLILIHKYQLGDGGSFELGLVYSTSSVFKIVNFCFILLSRYEFTRVVLLLKDMYFPYTVATRKFAKLLYSQHYFAFTALCCQSLHCSLVGLLLISAASTRCGLRFLIRHPLFGSLLLLILVSRQISTAGVWLLLGPRVAVQAELSAADVYHPMQCGLL